MKRATLTELLAASRIAGVIAEALTVERSQSSTKPHWIYAVPVKTVGESNKRFASLRGVFAKSARVKKQRAAARLLTRRAQFGPTKWPKSVAMVGVRMTRHAPSVGLDDDNLRSALKAVRDGIADALGIDDGDGRLVWHYDERRAPAGMYFVTVALFPVAAKARS